MVVRGLVFGLNTMSVQYSTVQYSKVQANMPALALLRVNKLLILGHFENIDCDVRI